MWWGRNPTGFGSGGKGPHDRHLLFAQESPPTLRVRPSRAALLVTHKLGGIKDREEEPRIQRIRRMATDRSVPSTCVACLHSGNIVRFTTSKIVRFTNPAGVDL